MGISLLGAEWVLYLLVILSIISVALIIERIRFYRDASAGIEEFRQAIRNAAKDRDISKTLEIIQKRQKERKGRAPDFESLLSTAILETAKSGKASFESLSEAAQDTILRTRQDWEKNLSILATIGSNAPFVGLFGTVLGIIQAFHDLSQQVGTGVQTVTAGLSDALVATAVGIFVAIPAVVAFNFFQRRVRSALGQADALKSFLVGKLLG